MSAPLADVHVCDLTQNLAGPYCSQILADLGATVVKVEPPEGDAARPWGPPSWGSASALFLSVNRGKRSIVLDLKSERGKDVLGRLASKSDVFLQASRPGVAERLGFDYDSIRALRPDVVHLSISAYGSKGPLSHLPGYDPLMQAYSGLMSLTGHEGMPPTRVGGAVIDYGTGMWAAVAILAALRQRDRTGEGTAIETSLLDTSLGWVSYHLTGFMATGNVPAPMGSGVPAIAPYQAFPTTDGHVMIAAGNDKLFRRLCVALDLPELTDDPRFLTNPLRASHHAELIPVIEERTRTRTTAAMLDLTRTHGVPCSAIHDIGEVVADAQVAANGMLTPAPHPEVDDYRDVGLPLQLGGTRPHAGRPPPLTGEHTGEVLRELGYTEEECAELTDASGVAASESVGT